MRSDWDVVVVGLGGIGSAAACWAARLGSPRGLRVLGLEQFELGHPYGASEDVSRIIRRSYHRREYVRLADRAYATWAEIEADTGARIVHRTGGLDVGPPAPRDGVAIDLVEYEAAMAAEGIAFERLDAAEIMRRWPAWRLPDDHVGLFQADSGIADPSQGNPAHRRLAVEHGATLRDRSPVVSIASVDGSSANLLTLAGGEQVAAGRLILATDAWTNELLGPLGRTLPLTITQEQVSWFEPAGDPSAFDPERFPVWIWMDEPSFYGFPTHAAPGPKLGQDVGGGEVTPATRTFERDPDAHDRVLAFLDAHLPAMGPAAGGRVVTTKSCLYTMTPDRDFLVDRVPELPAAWACLGSAHGYKFASVLGRILAELAILGDSPSRAELGPFALDRPALVDPSIAPTFVI